MLLNIFINNPEKPPVACIIWMHGLGADANDMAGLARQLPLDLPIRHVFINAPIRPVTMNNNMPMRAWFDIIGLSLSDREDREGILQSQQMICDIIERQRVEGFETRQIFLAGFSQGAAMALRTSLSSITPLGGVISLSGYLPLAAECQPMLDRDTPIWIAGGQFDPIVIPDWTAQSFNWLLSHGFKQVSHNTYPMEHTICLNEIKDLARWLSSTILSIKQCNGVVTQ